MILAEFAATLAAHRGLAAKADIAAASRRLGLSGAAVQVGDDCAAIPDGDGHLLLAIEGFQNAFVAAEPWFAGWCSVMVNLSDVAAMGGRPLAVVDALWADGEDAAAAVFAGMRAASERYGVPVVGGHTNLATDRHQLAVAVLGRANTLITSFDARPGDRLVAAIDLCGRYRPRFDNFDAASEAPPQRLRKTLAVLPEIAEAGLARAAKDISQAGLVGTVAMLAECSRVGALVDVRAVPIPAGVPLARWLVSFPSFGFVLAVAAGAVADVVARFAACGVAAAEIGAITPGRTVAIADGSGRATVRDLAAAPLLGVALAERA